MKIRLDYVTNSSSSSYVCIAKVDMCDELREYMKEEFGKFGLRLLDEYVRTGAEIKKSEYNRIYEILEYSGELDSLEDDKHYLDASFVVWTSDGDTDGNDAFLYSHIPEKYMEEIYHGEAD